SFYRRARIKIPADRNRTSAQPRACAANALAHRPSQSGHYFRGGSVTTASGQCLSENARRAAQQFALTVLERITRSAPGHNSLPLHRDSISVTRRQTTRRRG